MKQQYTLTELAQKLDTLETQKRDFVTDTRKVEFIAGDQADCALAFNDETFQINDVAHSQICQNLGIPKKYYDRMRADAPGLLMENVNNWLHHEPSKRMVRAICNGENTARAWLSDRYRRIDNYAIAQAALPALSELPEVRIESTALTEKNMYIKAVLPTVQAEVNVGDVVQAGISIRNSEVGHGAVLISLFIYRLICKNGMTVPGAGSRTNHIGRNIDGGADVYELFSDEAMEADDQALMLKVRDLVRGAANDLKFQTIVEKMREAANSSRIADPVGTVEELGRRFYMPQDEQKGIMQHLIEGADLSAYGLLNAVTRFSQDVTSYERATELENIGGQILDLKPGEWTDLAKAA